MLVDAVTVAIPHIPVRRDLLIRAMRSIQDQVLPAASIAVATDYMKQGAAVNRQRALDMVKTPWTAFLDDDDEFMPEHLQLLMTHALDTGADYVFSWFQVVGGIDPFPQNRLLEFDPQNPKHTTITVLVKTELAQAVGFTQPDDSHPGWGGEDYNFTLGCIEAGAKISQLPNGQRTWFWHHDSKNTSGRPERW